MSYRIVTDTCCDLPEQMYQELLSDLYEVLSESEIGLLEI